MADTETADLAAQIAEESASLPREKQSAILDFILYLKYRLGQSGKHESEGDAAWERIIADPRPRPKLDAYLKSIEKEATEPMDFDRL